MINTWKFTGVKSTNSLVVLLGKIHQSNHQLMSRPTDDLTNQTTSHTGTGLSPLLCKRKILSSSAPQNVRNERLAHTGLPHFWRNTAKYAEVFLIIINPWCACAARVTVLGLCVCVSVCLLLNILVSTFLIIIQVSRGFKKSHFLPTVSTFTLR